MAISKKPKTEDDWAHYYGWALAIFKSDPELYKLFKLAIKETWKPELFVAKLRDSKWYKTHSESYRNAIALKYSDPDSWRQKVKQIYSNIQNLAGQMGIRTSWTVMWDMAEDALSFGWDNSQLRSALSKYLTGSSNGYYGEAGQAEDQLRQYAYQMGVKLDDGALQGWLKGILNGSRTVDDYKGYLQKLAISAFPTLADDIRGGMMVRDIAAPYMESMGRILEIDANALDLQDPTIRQALTNVNQDSGKPELKPLWQFENDLRKDPRWLQTNNAREGINGVARQVLKDFGFSY